MNKSTIDILAGIVFIVMGIWFITCYKSLANKTVRFQFKTFHMHYKDKPWQFVFLVGGMAFTVFGFLLAFRIIQTR